MPLPGYPRTARSSPRCLHRLHRPALRHSGRLRAPGAWGVMGGSGGCGRHGPSGHRLYQVATEGNAWKAADTWKAADAWKATGTSSCEEGRGFGILIPLALLIVLHRKVP